jgi:maleate cis-trans isomerase
LAEAGLDATRMRHAAILLNGINVLFWLDKPVLAINTCIYWWSLRQNGIDDKIEGFGSLLLEH